MHLQAILASHTPSVTGAAFMLYATVKLTDYVT